MNAAMDNWVPRHRITADEYHRMAEVGLLAPDARVELIEGVIIDRAPIGNPHNAAVDWLTQTFVQGLAGRAIVRVQGSVRLDDFSEPQPDVVLLKPRKDFYRTRHARSQDCLLVVEVSESSLRYDRQLKVPFYARRGVPEVWIVDVGNMRLHLYRNLVDAEYKAVSTTATPGITPIASIPEFTMDLSPLFGT